MTHPTPTSTKKSELDALLKEPSPKRPILTAGIWLAAFVILALIVLTPLVANVVGVYQEGTYARNVAFSAAAYLVLLIAIPCVAGIVLTIMFNLYIPRKFRLTLASITYGVAILLFWLALFACLLPSHSFNSARMLQLVLQVIDTTWWLLILLGLALGVSLPVTSRAHRHARTYQYHLQHRIHVACSLLAWFFCSGAVLAITLSTTYFEVLQQTLIPYVALTVLLPAGLFSLASSLFAKAARKDHPHALVLRLAQAPLARLDALLAFCILLVAGAFAPGLMWVVWVFSALLGAAFGLAVANLKK